MIRLLQNKQIIVVCGSGGVGKTTLSSAIALMGAIKGKRSIVLTIDPARRLAQVLGLRKLDGKIRKISSSVFARAKLNPLGSLYAVMLDTRRAFDRVIERTAPSPAISARILANPIYDHMAGFMAGSHEYMAMEKLLEFHQSGEYDLLVLDTPPTRHAMDFLDAPKRMMDFLDDSVFKWFLKPSISFGRFPLRILEKGFAFNLGALERITGIQILGELAEFFGNFSGMYKGFKERASKVRNLLSSASTAFILVTSPNRSDIPENRFFCERLLKENIPLSGAVINRVRTIDSGQETFEDAPNIEDLSELLKHNESDINLKIKKVQHLLDKLRKNYQWYQRMAEIDSLNIKALKKQLPVSLKTVHVPMIEQNVHNLKSLHVMGEYLLK